MSTRLVGSLAALCALAFTPAWAQDAATPVTNVSTMTPLAPADAAITGVDEAPAAITCCHLPDGTVIELETMEPISSARAKRGDHFRLRTTEAITVDDVLVLPAGTEGVGEVIHADKARSGGKAGELLLAARSLQLDGRSVPLRGMQLGRNGKDQSQASLAVSMALGPLGLFVQGGEVVIPAGTPAHAKLKGAFEWAGPATAASSTSAESTSPAAPATASEHTASPDNDVTIQPQKE